jgi:hypothetical protein
MSQGPFAGPKFRDAVMWTGQGHLRLCWAASLWILRIVSFAQNIANWIKLNPYGFNSYILIEIIIHLITYEFLFRLRID